MARSVPAKPQAAPIVVKNTEALEEILTGQDALAAAPALVEAAEEAYFNLGGVLAHIYHEGLYKGAGYDGPQGFADYTKAELGVDYRKVALQRVANHCSGEQAMGH